MVFLDSQQYSMTDSDRKVPSTPTLNRLGLAILSRLGAPNQDPRVNPFVGHHGVRGSLDAGAAAAAKAHSLGGRGRLAHLWELHLDPEQDVSMQLQKASEATSQRSRRVLRGFQRIIYGLVALCNSTRLTWHGHIVGICHNDFGVQKH